MEKIKKYRKCPALAVWDFEWKCCPEMGPEAYMPIGPRAHRPTVDEAKVGGLESLYTLFATRVYESPPISPVVINCFSAQSQETV